jgi:hypothetical protein
MKDLKNMTADELNKDAYETLSHARCNNDREVIAFAQVQAILLLSMTLQDIRTELAEIADRSDKHNRALVESINELTNATHRS